MLGGYAFWALNAGKLATPPTAIAPPLSLPFGLATRAAAENEAAAMLSGLSPNVISLTNTLLASLLAGALGILAASITQLDPSTLPLQIIPALAAALIASFTSFGIAAGASFGIAVR